MENNNVCIEVLEAIRKGIDTMPTRSAWNRGVNIYAEELFESLEDSIHGGYITAADLLQPHGVSNALLNGAKDYRPNAKQFQHWVVYSYGGSSLIYDGDIANRLCTPSELRKTRNGELPPSTQEQWLDVQARALYQAAAAMVHAARPVIAHYRAIEAAATALETM